MLFRVLFRGCETGPAVSRGGCTGRMIAVGGLAASGFANLSTVEAFEGTVLALHGRSTGHWPLQFATLRAALADGLLADRFFGSTLPAIVRHASRAEILFPEGVPVLDGVAAAAAAVVGAQAGTDDARLAFSRPELASLLSCAFLCTIPDRDHHDQQQGFGPFSFLRLFAEGAAEEFKVAKLRLLLHYYEQLDTAAADDGTHIELRRLAVTPDASPQWTGSVSPLPRLTLDWAGSTEDSPSSVQVGMSNRYPGGAPGGVLATGKMQEPIYFACRPELLAMLLVCPAIAPNEAILATGARLYSAASGVVSANAHRRQLQEPCL